MIEALLEKYAIGMTLIATFLAIYLALRLYINAVSINISAKVF